jgi:hypothetical protein
MMRRSDCTADAYIRTLTCPGLVANVSLFPAVVTDRHSFINHCDFLFAYSVLYCVNIQLKMSKKLKIKL